MKDFNIRTKGHDEWLTPPEIIRSLGTFDLDPCDPINKPWPTASKHYTIKDDGFNLPWFGRVWLNPPYGRETFRWVRKLAAHGSGIALIFARTETKGYHDYVWNKAHSIFFFKGRLSFYYVTGEKGMTAPAPSCLVAYSPKDTMALENSGLPGKLVALR